MTQPHRFTRATLLLAAALTGCGAEAPPANWVTVTDRASHAPYFEIAQGSHAATECTRCHTAPSTFARFDCQGCHGQAVTAGVHALVTGFVWESTACVGCHRGGGGQVDRAAHAARFPIAAPTVHQTTACAECHVDPADRSVVDCATCHAPTSPAQHARVGGWGTASCLTCHAECQVHAVAAHAAFAITAGAHAGAACLACHTASRTDKAFAADFTRADCLGCHAQGTTTTTHAGVSGFAYATASCLGCHADGTVGTVDRASHQARFPIAAPAVHAAAACSSCHTNPADRSVVACSSCHGTTATTSQHARVGGWAGAACVACHAESQVYAVSAHGTFTITAGSHAGRPCLECHTTRRTDKPWAANFDAVDCLGCHGQTRTSSQHAGRSGYAWQTSACLRCHPSGR